MNGRLKRMLSLRTVAVLAAICILVPAPAMASQKTAQTTAPEGTQQGELMQRLVKAYPDFLARSEGNDIVWKDGARMSFDDGRRDKDFAALLDNPDIEDQFYTPYLRGRQGLAPGKDVDPGRVRFEPLFRKMYGDCRAGEVEKHLVPVVWLPQHDGSRIMVTKVNGVARRLAAVIAELDRLVARRPEMLEFLSPPAGTYNCRVIAGTNRLSVHAYGAAIDIATKHAHYWRWPKAANGKALVWQNAIPLEIVEIFEQHGFIWGGKWYHYDTMHFEYRPELLVAEEK